MEDEDYFDNRWKGAVNIDYGQSKDIKGNNMKKYL